MLFDSHHSAPRYFLVSQVSLDGRVIVPGDGDGFVGEDVVHQVDVEEPAAICQLCRAPAWACEHRGGHSKSGPV